MEIINNFVPDRSIFTNGIKNTLNVNQENESQKVNKSNFSETLKSALKDVNESQITAESKTMGFIQGDTDLHGALVATEEARLSLELAVQVRNKIINAYEEFNKMQV